MVDFWAEEVGEIFLGESWGGGEVGGGGAEGWRGVRCCE
jgi:hypothetical protein